MKKLTDYSKKENQIGCGWCANEKLCDEHNSRINNAKQGCPAWMHWTESRLIR